MRKLKLELDAVSVETFVLAAGPGVEKGTVHGQSMTAQRQCYTPVYDCYTVPWVYEECAPQTRVCEEP